MAAVTARNRARWQFLLVVNIIACYQAPGTAAHRQLSQTVGGSSSSSIPGCAVYNADGSCARCSRSLLLNVLSGRCTCAAGAYAADSPDVGCVDCFKGSWCPGGPYAGFRDPGPQPCGDSLTTLGRRAFTNRLCVNVPGTFYSLADGIPRATPCPADTYVIGMRKQRACVPCPAGMSTMNKTGQASAAACVPLPGYIRRSSNSAAACARGEFRGPSDPDDACRKCAAGVTTAGLASTSEADCNVVLPSFCPAQVGSGAVKQVQLCPQSYYCPGGPATEAFDPTSPVARTANTVVQCPSGTWTAGLGNSNPSQCLTPPGYKTTNGATLPCADGEYRSTWARPAIAAACDACGAGIGSEAQEELVQYALTPDATPRSILVRAQVESCFIKPGQGMTYAPSTNTYSAQNCDKDSFGVPSIVYGQLVLGCRPCPKGMITSTSLPNSAQWFVTDEASPPRQGFTDPLACVTPAGFGYDGRAAYKCPSGSWNPAGGYSMCSQCPLGMGTLPGIAAVSADNCTIAKGYGFYAGGIQPCPLGTYNDEVRPNTTAPCTPCPPGQWSSVEGGQGARDCDVCMPGWGEAACATQCGAANGANYGSAGRARGSRCDPCPVLDVGWSFDFKGTRDVFTPRTVARAGATTRSGCLAEFLQLSEPAWQVGGNASMTPVPGVASFAACVDACSADDSCQYVTYDYQAPACSKKVATGGSDLMAFKVMSVGDVVVSSLRRRQRNTTAQLLGSGSYTFWRDNAADVGAETTTVGPTADVLSCCAACDADEDCMAAVMPGLASPSDAPAQCLLVKGDSTVTQWKRSVTRVVLTRLSAQSAFAGASAAG